LHEKTVLVLSGLMSGGWERGENYCATLQLSCVGW